MKDMATTIHPFESAGLGIAPFRLVGMVHQEKGRDGQRVIGTSAGGIEITTKPGGTCDFCGHYILNIFRVGSADGREFSVGCDCVTKVDAKLGEIVQKMVKVNKDDRDQARINLARQRAETIAKSGLMSRPHPSREGNSMLDYVLWLFENAGKSGKLRAARIVEAANTPKADE